MEWKQRRRVNQDCINASNPFHVCAEYCARGPAGGAPSSRVPPLAKSAAQNGAEKLRADSKQRRVEISAQNLVEDRKFDAGHILGEISGCNSAQDGEIRVVDKLKLERKQYKGESSSSSSGDSSIFSSGRRKVDPACPNSSNPFHVCAEYCNQKILEMGGRSVSSTPRGRKRFLGPFTTRGSKGATKVTARKDVHPNCLNASNPFHKCSDYCFQRMNVAM